jgi:RNA recognition motif-containing protein
MIVVQDDFSRVQFTCKGRGVIYVGNLPKDFYEEPLYKYFKQFGDITGLKVARSRKTGNPMGYAFIQFKRKEVTQIVVQATNNYVLGDSVLKCSVVDAEKANKIRFGEKLLPKARSVVSAVVKNNDLTTKVGLSKPCLDHKVEGVTKLNEWLSQYGIVDFEHPLETENYEILAEIAEDRDARHVKEKIKYAVELKSAKTVAKAASRTFRDARSERLDVASDDSEAEEEKAAATAETTETQDHKKLRVANEKTSKDEESASSEIPPQPSLIDEASTDSSQSTKKKKQKTMAVSSEQLNIESETVESTETTKKQKKKKKKLTEEAEIEESTSSEPLKKKKKKLPCADIEEPEPIESSECSNLSMEKSSKKKKLLKSPEALESASTAKNLKKLKRKSANLQYNELT